LEVLSTFQFYQSAINFAANFEKILQQNR